MLRGRDARERMDNTIQECPEFLYSYSPEGTQRDRRYVFKRRTIYGIAAREKAYAYALEVKLGIQED